MAKKIETIKKELSVKAYQGMIAVFPQFEDLEERMDLSWAPKFEGRYATHNSTVCFVSEGETYISPYTDEVVEALREAGFKEDYFLVPFSNQDYPKLEEELWGKINARAAILRKRKFVAKCEEYCREHGIHHLEDEVLRNCFQIPEEGVEVKHFYAFKPTMYYPVIRSAFFDCTVIQNLGKYCMNNGRVVFVDSKGDTYVAKGDGIVMLLKSKGYTESSMFVPFSNGEEITDSDLRNHWDALTE